MQVRLILRPGDNGTKKLLNKYGDRLVCVRYRYDAVRAKRYKTVELVEEVSPWEGGEFKPKATTQPAEPRPSDRFGVRIGYDELELRDQAKQIGAIWRPKQKLWELTYAQIEALGLQNRIVANDEEV